MFLAELLTLSTIKAELKVSQLLISQINKGGNITTSWSYKEDQIKLDS